MNGLARTASYASDSTLRLLRASLQWTAPVRSSSTLGDGDSRLVALAPGPVDAPTSHGPSPDDAWDHRAAALQGEARAALRAPLSAPPTWDVG